MADELNADLIMMTADGHRDSSMDFAGRLQNESQAWRNVPLETSPSIRRLGKHVLLSGKAFALVKKLSQPGWDAP